MQKKKKHTVLVSFPFLVIYSSISILLLCSAALLCCSALLLCSAARGSGSDDAGVDVQRSAVHYRTVAEIHSR
jgi:hypothetical protein